MIEVISPVIARYTATLTYADLPGDVRCTAKRCLLDWMGAVFAARNEAVALRLRELAASLGGHPDATIIAFGDRTSWLNACLVNGSMAHLAESDDIFREGIYHPGAPTIAAALAVAEKIHSSGRELIVAIVGGYEVSTRIAQAINPSHYRFWHTTGTVGTLGAAIAAAILLRLNETQTIHALGLAATQAAGLAQTIIEQTDGKPLHSGKAALNGALAAFLAASGFNGPQEPLMGLRGFCRVVSNSIDEDALTRGLGDEHNILKVTFKFYPSCGHTHSAIDAALYLAREEHLGPEDIAEVDLSTYSAAVDVAGNDDPKTPYEAKFSLRYCVAVALAFGEVTSRLFEPSVLQSPDIRHVMERIRVRRDPALDEEFPAKRTSIIRIVTKDGRELTRREDYRKGDPEKPLSEDDVKVKFMDLGRNAGISCGRLTAIAERIMNIEDVEDVSFLCQAVSESINS
ncbi:MAG TPA: MmgE/PrpD family protein [Firmicutes bacterium]|nr:MmgE/PrpD family protein [Bacillota bacterium]